MTMKMIITLRPTVLLIVVWNRNTEFADFELTVIVWIRLKKSSISGSYNLPWLSQWVCRAMGIGPKRSQRACHRWHDCGAEFKEERFNRVDSFQRLKLRYCVYMFANNCFRSLDNSSDESTWRISGWRKTNLCNSCVLKERDMVDTWL